MVERNERAKGGRRDSVAAALHGLFASGEFRRAWLAEQGIQSDIADDHETPLMASLELLADALEQAIDPALLEPLFGGATCR